jgi:hypothetical protein
VRAICYGINSLDAILNPVPYKGNMELINLVIRDDAHKLSS